MIVGGKLELTNGYVIAYNNNYSTRYDDYSEKSGFVIMDSDGQQIGGLYEHVADALEDALKYEN